MNGIDNKGLNAISTPSLCNEKNDNIQSQIQQEANDLLSDYNYNTVGIKSEYCIITKENDKNDDTQTNSEEKQQKSKQYKNKRNKQEVGLKSREDYYTLCRYVEMGKECPYGTNCKYEHNTVRYFANRPVSFDTKCPIWEKHGYCPSGMNCCWSKSHTDWNSMKTIAKPENEQIPIVEENDGSILSQCIRKKKYTFRYLEWKDELLNQSNEDESTVFPRSLADEEQHHIDFKNKIYIAPLTTVGNLPFRRICVDYGADITCSEMALCSNLLKSSASEWALVKRHPCETCFGVQLATGRIEEAAAVCELLQYDLHVDFVDLNAGCPIEGIGKAGAGAGLLTKVGRLKRVIRSMLSSLTTLPLLVKIRTGDHENTSHKLIPQLQQLRGRHGNHIDGVIIHGRTKQGRYTTTADWDYVKYCTSCQSHDLPQMSIIGNGDIFDSDMYWHYSNYSNVDGIMIGRGALIKPWICKEIKDHCHYDISATERLDIIRTYCQYGLEHWGSDIQGVDRTRRFLLEWLSFLCRYVPYGILERPQTINQRVYAYQGRNELETLLGSRKVDDWIHITELFLGKVSDDFNFIPKHRSNAYIL